MLIKRISTHNFKQVILSNFSSTTEASSELIIRELYLDNQVVRLVLKNQKHSFSRNDEYFTQRISRNKWYSKNASNNFGIIQAYGQWTNLNKKMTIYLDFTIILAAEGSVFFSGHDLKKLVFFVILRFFIFRRKQSNQKPIFKKASELMY